MCYRSSVVGVTFVQQEVGSGRWRYDSRHKRLSLSTGICDLGYVLGKYSGSRFPVSNL